MAKRQAHLCEIVENEEIASNIYRLVCKNEIIAQMAQPGQIVYISCGGATYLRRPFGICDCTNDTFTIIFEIRGVGTKELAGKPIHYTIDCIGPQGNGFAPNDKPSVIVGGGIGVPPLLFLAKKLVEPIVVLGFRSADKIILRDEFGEYAKKLYVCTDDGSYGHHGLVTDIIEQEKDEIAQYFACGPTPMLKAIQRLAMKEGKPSQISLEQRMACGVGACMACVCNIGGTYKRVCADGPVFFGREVDLDAKNHY